MDRPGAASQARNALGIAVRVQLKPEAIMRSDSEIERDVREELKWDPDLDASDIAVSVKNGVVTLAGFVKSFTGKYEAEAAAKRVAGVTAVANDIEVRMPSVDERPDPEIARDAVAAIKSQLPISSEHIKIVVKDGWVTLEGQVEWQYQRQTAEVAVRRIKGVKGVSNLIQLKPRARPDEIKKKIEEAFKRSAEVDANRIMVETNGSEVILKGTVRSWVEREEAERVAWSAPGVTKVSGRVVSDWTAATIERQTEILHAPTIPYHLRERRHPDQLCRQSVRLSASRNRSPVR
jgi:osmotically-inducible protein OsmY